ncbi:MAG: cytochrome c oxidase subunit II [Proteobacteria bacterium]|nr:cytochrome c oxidase subunit II [Pseudomonadota bacterium]
MRFPGKFVTVLALAVGPPAWFAGGAPALAQAPRPWQLGFQDAATPVMERIDEFHDLMLVIITVIVVFVTGLLVYVVVRFNEKANPVPSKTTHHTVLEVAWTVVPIMILVLIAIPSFRLLYYMDKAKTPGMTLKVVGNQWYWSYVYPDHGKIAFDSLIIPDDQLKPGQLRLLEVDNRVVVPVDTDIRVLLTANAVIHAWAVPAFGVKIDTVPGRMNETWMRVTKPGVYYGQCSELCGVNHGFMPIAVEAVSKAEFAKWVAWAKVKFAAQQAPDRPSPELALAAGAPPGAVPGR